MARACVDTVSDVSVSGVSDDAGIDTAVLTIRSVQGPAATRTARERMSNCDPVTRSVTRAPCTAPELVSRRSTRR
jgi:hypothetical protein